MARYPEPKKLPPPRLLKSRAQIAASLEERIAKGRELLGLHPRNQEELDSAQAERRKWSEFNRTLLENSFDNASVAEEYGTGRWGAIAMNPSFGQTVDAFRNNVSYAITKLESVRDRLPLYSESATVQSTSHAEPSDRTKVFIVHGHREDTLQAVARFVEQLALSAIILSEQPHGGRTLIEKIEANSDVGFAIVLLTADDVGAAKAEADNLKPRARQNALLELGYFVGKLGRPNVCVLYEQGVELPSDLLGVGWHALDKGEDWKLRLARELRAAGMRIDLNRAL